MPEQPTNQNVASDEKIPSPNTPAIFTLAVSILVIVIVFVLSFLWYSERNKRIVFQRDAASVQSLTTQYNLLLTENDRMQLEMMKLSAIQSFASQNKVPSVSKAKCSTMPITIDGEIKTVYRISQEAAKLAGDFESGDVIVVID